MLESMKIGERGQVTSPKEIRDKFGLRPDTEVEFFVVKGSVVLKKAPKKLNLHTWKGRAKESFAALGYSVEALRREAHFLASRVWRTYRKQGGRRPRSLPVFLLVAHP